MLLRGVLQARGTFVVPPGVAIAAARELGPDDAFLVVGAGSDGREYVSTEVFPQDAPGEVVQVVRWRGGVYGLRADGVLERVGPETGGAARPSRLADGLVLVYVGRAELDGRRDDLVLVDAANRVHAISGDPPRLERPPRQPPPGVRFTAVGQDADDRLVARDAAGEAWVWAALGQEWERSGDPVVIATATPSLRAAAAPGELVRAERGPEAARSPCAPERPPRPSVPRGSLPSGGRPMEALGAALVTGFARREVIADARVRRDGRRVLTLYDRGADGGRGAYLGEVGSTSPGASGASAPSAWPARPGTSSTRRRRRSGPGPPDAGLAAPAPRAQHTGLARTRASPLERGGP